MDKVKSWKGAFILLSATAMILIIFLQDTYSFNLINPNPKQKQTSPNTNQPRHEPEPGPGPHQQNEPVRKEPVRKEPVGIFTGSNAVQIAIYDLKVMAGAVEIPGVVVRLPTHGNELGSNKPDIDADRDDKEDDGDENAFVVESSGVVSRLGNTSYCDCVKRSSLISKDCGNTKFDRKFPLLVTGIGRSGTDFIHSELWAMGLRVSHDSNVGYGRIDGSVAWPEAFNNKPFMTHSARTKKAKRKTCKHEWWNFGKRWYGYYHVFHLVRHPLKTIQSRFNLGNIESFEMSGLCNTGTRTNKALRLLDRRLDITMQHWTLWNSFVEQYAVYRFRLEQLNSSEKHSVMQRILRLSKLDKLHLKGVNMTQVEASIDTVKVSTKKNSKHTKKAAEALTWKKLAEINPQFTAMTQVQALRYGYDVPKEELLPFVWDKCDPKTLKVQRCYIEYYEGRWSCKLFSDNCASDRR